MSAEYLRLRYEYVFQYPAGKPVDGIQKVLALGSTRVEKFPSASVVACPTRLPEEFRNSIRTLETPALNSLMTRPESPAVEPPLLPPLPPLLVPEFVPEFVPELVPEFVPELVPVVLDPPPAPPHPMIQAAPKKSASTPQNFLFSIMILFCRLRVSEIPKEGIPPASDSGPGLMTLTHRSPRHFEHLPRILAGPEGTPHTECLHLA